MHQVITAESQAKYVQEFVGKPAQPILPSMRSSAAVDPVWKATCD